MFFQAYVIFRRVAIFSLGSNNSFARLEPNLDNYERKRISFFLTYPGENLEL